MSLSEDTKKPIVLIENDEMAIGVENVKYVCVTLTKEQYDMIKFKQMDFYEIDGKTFFDVKKNEEKTGEVCFFVLFV